MSDNNTVPYTWQGPVNHGNFPFASSTGDADYGLFFSARDMELFNDYNTELLGIIAQTGITYYRIEPDSSDPNSIYGESEVKVTRDPVQVYCWVMLDEPETETNSFTVDTRRRIELYMHKDRLTELDLVPRMGDFVGYDNQYFEILRASVPNFVFSYPQTKLGVIVRCLSVREGVFDPDRDFVNKEYVGDAENPY